LPFDLYPLFLLVLGIAFICVSIIFFRVNAFLALIGAALLIGFLSARVVVAEPPGGGTPVLNLVQAPKQVAFAFGDLMGRIGLAIAFATIVGKALMDSGAADRIVRFFTGLFGERHGAFALLVSGFVLAIPVFFDTVFFLLVPLAKALRLRTGKDYLLYVTAIGAGGAITHSLVPPTPGPIGMAAELKVDLGTTILVGLAVGAPLSLLGFGYATVANRLWPVPLRQVGDVPLEELEGLARRPDHELPSLWASVLPILLPVLFITSATLYEALLKADPGYAVAWQAGGVTVTLEGVLDLVGDPNVALLIAAVVAMALVMRQKAMTWHQLGKFTASALDEAGMILLITCAGGSFGAMLKAVGVGDTLGAMASAWGVPVLLLAWALAALFKIAQGSGTVAMITTAQIVMGIVVGQMGRRSESVTTDDMTAFLGYHPIYLVMAIGCGSKIGSWMNDSGFWVVSKMGGLTEGETLRSWTITLVLMGLAGLPLVWLLSVFLPLS
jgi:GntP family gluconate:H+ symporter